jgi:integrase
MLVIAHSSIIVICSHSLLNSPFLANCSIIGITLLGAELGATLQGRQMAPALITSFGSGTSKMGSATNNWNNQLRALWPLVEWPNGKPVKQPHSHMFRHTFAKEFLESEQGDIRDLARFLGHASIRDHRATLLGICS